MWPVAVFQTLSMSSSTAKEIEGKIQKKDVLKTIYEHPQKVGHSLFPWSAHFRYTTAVVCRLFAQTHIP